MPDILIAAGWRRILVEARGEVSRLPREWDIEIVSATRAPDGSLRLEAAYNAFDMPLDESVAHPWRAWQLIRQAARARSLLTCEICGSAGRARGGGNAGLVRCDHHADVAYDPNDKEDLRHFLEDYGDGLDFMQEMQRMSRDSDDDTRR